MFDSKKVEQIRKMFPKGTEVILNYMDDPQAPNPGTTGVVDYVDDIGTIHVKWSNGSSLGLIYGEDDFEILK